MSEFNDDIVMGGIGLGCCLSAAALYLLGRSRGRQAEVLESVSRVNSLKDLAQLVDTASKALPLVVTVSGRVGSDSPISCKNSDLRGVIVNERVEQHFLKRDKRDKPYKCDKCDKCDKGYKGDKGLWKRDSELMSSKWEEVPWYLDDGTGRAYVVGACSADGFFLTKRSEVFKEPGTSDRVKDLKMLGMKRIERVLPTGTALTVIGEAVKDGIGAVRIEKPHDGPFIVLYNKTIDQLIANHGEWARFYKIASAGFAVFGVCLLASLLAKPALQYIFEWRRYWEKRKRLIAAAAKRQGKNNELTKKTKNKKGSQNSVENGSESNKRDRSESELCVMCLDQKYNSVFVPCGHMCCCSVCSSHLTNCPLCQKWIKQAVTTD